MALLEAANAIKREQEELRIRTEKEEREANSHRHFKVSCPFLCWKEKIKKVFLFWPAPIRIGGRSSRGKSDEEAGHVRSRSAQLGEGDSVTVRHMAEEEEEGPCAD